MVWLIASAFAKSWCATPVIAHEWGVTVLTADGSAPVKPPLPAHFHRSASPFAVARPPVRSLPADNGVRTLPVVHFWAPFSSGPVPIGVDVGFTGGTASVWYPAVDALSPAGAEVQLRWDALDLTADPGRPPASKEPWVEQARALDGSLWVHRGGESERFLFYEADTVETPAITVRVEGDAVRVTNRSAHPVHDVVIVRAGRAGRIRSVPAGLHASVRLDRAPESVRAELDRAWTAPPAEPDAECVMMRDPAVPAPPATDHRLYPAELELVWSVWAGRLLEDPGDRMFYREDPAALAEVMPLSVYTDMRHHVRLSRFGLVLVEGM